MSQYDTFAEAIAHMEGFYIPGSRAQRNNNPGNLNLEPWMERKYGAVLETIPPGVNEAPRFARFVSPADGWSAMLTLLTSDYLGLTVEAALNKWAPAADDNQPSSYIAGVCEMTGFTPDTVLSRSNLA